MIIIPLTGKPVWKNPPLVTLGIILVNCCIYFLFSSTRMSATWRRRRTMSIRAWPPLQAASPLSGHRHD
ncbi:hypothetical protein ACFL43_03140 [Thermodesulfobacteriota bacterium]